MEQEKQASGPFCEILIWYGQETCLYKLLQGYHRLYNEQTDSWTVAGTACGEAGNRLRRQAVSPSPSNAVRCCRCSPERQASNLEQLFFPFFFWGEGARLETEAD